jgi:hypothetical protein
MGKRKSSNDNELKTKFQKISFNHQIKDSYICELHNHSSDICRIYDCSGFNKKYSENLIKYYIK